MSCWPGPIVLGRMKTFARSEHKKIGQISLAQNFFVPFDRVRRGRFFLESFVAYSMRVPNRYGTLYGGRVRARKAPAECVFHDA